MRVSEPHAEQRRLLRHAAGAQTYGNRAGRRVRVKRYAEWPDVVLSIAVGTRKQALATAALEPDHARQLAAALIEAADLIDGGAR